MHKRMLVGGVAVVAALAASAAAAAADAAVAAPASAAASTPTAELQRSLGLMADTLSDYALTLAMVGAFVMALQEAGKKLLNLQARFHRSALAQWLQQPVPPPPSALQAMASLRGGQYGVCEAARAGHGHEQPFCHERAFEQLLQLTTGLVPGPALQQSLRPGHALTRNVGFALFELELARLMGLVQEAADVAIRYPTKYPDWFSFVVRGCDTADVATWRRWLATPPGDPQRPRDEEAQAVYARMQLLVKRQLDSFQTITAYRWREWNQLVAWGLGFAVLLVGQQLPELSDGQPFDPGGLDVLVALAGGVLAPVAKDLVDALRRVKSGG
jgi:hypothetical protein